MKPVPTALTTNTHVLPGGTEENNLPAYNNVDDRGNSVICSVWEPSQEERQAIADGMNIHLAVWGTRTPPVAIGLTDQVAID